MAVVSIVRWVAGKAFGFPPRQTGNVDVDKGLSIQMRDGVTLRADRYHERGQNIRPVVLIRSPYGRSAVFGIMAGLLAERGLQVVIQSVRGTWDSGGQFDPMRQEMADGADTLAWLRTQPWFSGQLFTFGPSYLGNVQYALADTAPEQVDGLALLMTLSNFRNELRAFGGFSLDTMLGWTHMMQDMTGYVPGQKLKRPKPGELDAIMAHLPLGTIDQAATGKTVQWWQDWLNHELDDPWWDSFDYSAAIPKMTAPATLIGGWQDIFLPFQVKDFEALQAAGKDAWLTIGPWSHASMRGMVEGLRQAQSMFSALAKGERPYQDRDHVRVYLQGAKEWRDYASWPPPGGETLRFHLRGGGRLDLAAPTGDEGVASYIYDPADPTPGLHGPKILGMAKVRDMSSLRQRKDMVSFTTDALAHDTDLIGPVAVDLSIRSDREDTDFYACLCDVDTKGRPLQVCDGYLRLSPGTPETDATGRRQITIDCWPTAYRFKRGHQLRLIVASGAFPRYARNLGTGEPIATATRMIKQHQEVLLGIDSGSSLRVIQVKS